MKKVSIIIPNNDSPIIDQVCLAIREQTFDLAQVEVIIVGSDERSLIPRDELIHFIPTGCGTNAAVNRNIGIQNAEGDILVFLDSDCLPDRNWLSALIARHNVGEKVVGGAFSFDDFNRWQLADNVSAFHEWLPFTTSGPRPYLPTANLSVHRDVLNAAGLMLPFLDLAEDLEWSIRIGNFGYTLFFDPLALVTHNPPRTTFVSVWQHWYYNAKYTLWVRWLYRASLGTPSLARYRALYFLFAPIIALWSTTNTFRHVKTRHKYMSTITIVYLTKLIWCLGAFFKFPDLEGTIP